MALFSQAQIITDESWNEHKCLADSPQAQNDMSSCPFRYRLSAPSNVLPEDRTSRLNSASERLGSQQAPEHSRESESR